MRNYTAHKIKVGQKVLNINEMDFNDITDSLVEFTLDYFYSLRFEFEEGCNTHVTNFGDSDVIWRTRDTYITSLHSVINLDTGEVIELSENDKEMILTIAKEKFYKSEEV